MKKIIFAVITLLTINCQSSKEIEDVPFEQLTNLIDSYAKEALDRNHINSIALAIYKDGEIYHNYYGSIDETTQNPPNDETHYEIASISKVFVGSLIARAVLDEKINLEDDIRQHLKSDYPNLEYEGTPITIKNLLTHTIGFKNRRPPKLEKIQAEISDGHYENKSVQYDIDDFLVELKTMELDKKPGTFFAYNSIGSELLAYILEQVYNDSFQNLLTAFLDELEMNDTYLQNSRAQASKSLINGYGENEALAPKSKSPLLGGGGGMVSTLPDLIKFMKFQLESNDPLIKESTRILFENSEETMGYLWQNMGVAEIEGFYYSKTGTSMGVQSGLLLCPDSNYGQIIIINNTSEAAYDDWASLYNKTETDLIMYPKINLMRLLKSDLVSTPQKGITNFKKLSEEEDKYFNTDLNYALNYLSYELVHERNDTEKAIELLISALKEFPEDANLYDSLGEMYFVSKDYTNALTNYKRSLELNPDNENAEEYIAKIDQLRNEN